MVPPPVYLMSYLVNYSNNNNCSGVELTLKTTFECHNYYESSSFLDCCEENVNRNMGSIALNECINSNFKNYTGIQSTNILFPLLEKIIFVVFVLIIFYE